VVHAKKRGCGLGPLAEWCMSRESRVPVARPLPALSRKTLHLLTIRVFRRVYSLVCCVPAAPTQPWACARTCAFTGMEGIMRSGHSDHESSVPDASVEGFASREAQLRALRDTAGRAIEKTDELIFLLDAERHVLAVSRGWTDRLGVPAEDIVGRHCHEHAHGTAAAAMDCPFAALLIGVASSSAEIQSETLGASSG
jgi:PAS domain-containing protein